MSAVDKATAIASTSTSNNRNNPVQVWTMVTLIVMPVLYVADVHLPRRPSATTWHSPIGDVSELADLRNWWASYHQESAVRPAEDCHD
ncbi:hypothetical protein [Streptomyces sp. AK08-02]|uniref:hypothetical protein n=1 Tax=Streptomyces sp. AK08-02 TaxID=3028654 RepID=UPI0029B392E8|nr:hypothetical protein [Streptomyces sp. AK08-02]MDX3749587.1 hypothetical protein [Streptomyces sp. AK08-02]